MSAAETATQVEARTRRRGDWMQTYTGKQFWPMDPRADEVDIVDIAHALSLSCRYAGHCINFYSVAEHSVLMTRWLQKQKAPIETQRWALLHDAAEAYLVDVPRPLKASLTGYAEAEANVMAAICERFALGSTEMPHEVKQVDNRILVDEYQQNLAPSAVDRAYKFGPRLGVQLQCWRPRVAETAFLHEFQRLSWEGRNDGK